MSPLPNFNPRLQSALAHARHGRPVLPVFWSRDGRCGCGSPACPSPAKHPIPDLPPLAKPPVWLYEHQPSHSAPLPNTRGYASAALASEEQQLLATPVGQRNQRLNLAAFRLARFIASATLTQAEVEGVLFAAATR